MRKISTAFLIIIFFLLQSTVFYNFSLAGITPNLLVILTACFGFMRGEKDGIFIGFFCGLMCDIFFGDILGLYALIYMYIGYLNGKFCGIFYPDDIKLPIALIVVSDITYGLICYILLFLMRGRFDFGYYFTKIILAEALYTILVTIFVYPIVLLINTKLEEFEKRRTQKFV